MKKVVLAGGTGFIGEYFKNRFKDLGYEIHIISRQKQHISWEDKLSIKEALEDTELLINLAGKSVNCRYNEANKNEIMNSRIRTTKILGEAIQACTNPPAIWMNSSTATIYRHAEDRPMTEEKGEIGSGFSVNVATNWEKTFFSFDLPKTRQIALRIAIVLGKDGGVMTPYRNLVKFGLGGIQGTGNQKFSWIHIDDLFQIVLFLKDKEELSGVFNCSSPQPVSNRELMKELRKTLNVPFGLPSPKWMLEIGSLLIKTETELVLKSRWVLPDRLEREGYTFTFKTLDKTLQNILK
ncbi:TIGR01777 family oxidoreductase [Cytobacillus firmus]|uniref:TIGR01777 family oxidoreductase n=1 Tax=Cytobacillus TaxID=2675230 RepID=UPI0020413A2A|nr:TIGR01777 family oxidoreductase [Cytobacillus oceanisediminis]MCM3242651.1 TIGR01777 family oxidoreductase [Cytobacillus oceanisediminis]MCS0822739.1 TIGR01777 family oxidoreductase [Cytobacillus firmus]